MTIARRDLVREGMPGVYHCTARCVRRAFLLGQDDYSGKNYDHRRQWIENGLRTAITPVSMTASPVCVRI